MSFSRDLTNQMPPQQNHRMVGVGRDLCGSSRPTPLLKQGHLQQANNALLTVRVPVPKSLRRFFHLRYCFCIFP